MCGICGFVGPGNRDVLQRMCGAMVHRGPDAEGLWTDPEAGVYLGHRRLSILDLATGDQPMWTADGGLGVVFNGEIYNHRELRRELEGLGHRFVTDHADTEVLLHGYRQWGPDCVHRLNGMWAFALYDRGQGELFLSRDRFGKKPLFYTLQNGAFAFASELTALARHPALECATDRLALKKYFAYGYIPAPYSLYRRIHKLPAGHSLCFRLAGGALSTWRYWDFVIDPFPEVPRRAEEAWGEEIRRLLREAVKRRLVADVPLGVFLSGGIDSSSITAFASEAVGPGMLKTFSVGFEEKSFDETPYARQVAALFRTNNHHAVLSVEKGRDLLPQIAAMLDEPMGDSSLLPTFLLCRETRKVVTVALAGDGGDELFAGYDPYRALGLARLYSALAPRPLHRAVQMAVAALPVVHRNMSLDFRLKRSLRGLSYPRKLWNAVWLGALEPADLDDLFAEKTDLEEVYAEAIAAWDACPQDDLVDKTLQFYTKLYLQDDILVKADRASMMNSLEVRAPYLDIDLVDFVRRIPHRYKYRFGRTKHILKKALEPVLPREILYRPKKGFGMPVGRWFQEGHLSVDVNGFPPFLNRDFVFRSLARHQAKRIDDRAFLWNAWLLSAWGRRPSR